MIGGLVDGDKIEVLPERVERLANRLKVQCSTVVYYAMVLSAMLLPYHAQFHAIYPPAVQIYAIQIYYSSMSKSTPAPALNLL